MTPTFPCALIALLLAGCAAERPDMVPLAVSHDQELLLTRSEFRELMQELAPAPDLNPQAGEPTARELLDLRLQQQIDLGPLVTVSATSAIELKDLLLGIARQAERDIEIDPRIAGGVMLSVRQRPFLKVIERIADMANLRFALIDGVLRVELDEPYNETYRLNLLNLERNSSGTINTSNNVLQGDGGSVGGNGSSNSVETSTKGDIWGEVEASISHLLRSKAPERLSSANMQFASSVIGTDSDGTVNNSTSGEASLIDAQLAAAEALLMTDSIDAPPSPESDSSDSSAADGEDADLNYTIDRGAGLINVYATEKQHKVGPCPFILLF